MKKICLIIGCLLIAGVLLAGCGGKEGGTGSGTTGGSGTTAVDPKVKQCRDNITNIYSAIVDYRMRNGGTTPSQVSSLAGLLNPIPVEPFGGTYTITEDPDAPMGVTVTCSLGHDQY
jgi:hypothetical protein